MILFFYRGGKAALNSITITSLILLSAPVIPDGLSDFTGKSTRSTVYGLKPTPSAPAVAYNDNNRLLPIVDHIKKYMTKIHKEKKINKIVSKGGQ